MPTYDKKCTACGFEFTRFEQMSKPDKKCPKCQEEKVERKIGAGCGLIFKGKGFYATDYNKKKENNGIKFMDDEAEKIINTPPKNYHGARKGIVD